VADGNPITSHLGDGVAKQTVNGCLFVHVFIAYVIEGNILTRGAPSLFASMFVSMHLCPRPYLCPCFFLLPSPHSARCCTAFINGVCPRCCAYVWIGPGSNRRRCAPAPVVSPQWSRSCRRLFHRKFGALLTPFLLFSTLFMRASHLF
jgi:hypothetical protein